MQSSGVDMKYIHRLLSVEGLGLFLSVYYREMVLSMKYHELDDTGSKIYYESYVVEFRQHELTVKTFYVMNTSLAMVEVLPKAGA